MPPYLRFALMILASSLLMYAVMYLNTYEISHVYFSQTRMWMTLMSAATMAIVMLSFMLHMLQNRIANLSIIAAAIIVFGASLMLVRSQATVDDVAYMEAMIPHHSIAILTSRNANISDLRVRDLADGIIEAQVREIGEMKELIADLKSGDN